MAEQDQIVPNYELATEAIASGIESELTFFQEMEWIAGLAVTTTKYGDPQKEERVAEIQVKLNNRIGNSLDASIPSAIKIVYAEPGYESQPAAKPLTFEPALAVPVVEGAKTALEQCLDAEVYPGTDVIVTDYGMNADRVAQIEVQQLTPAFADAEGMPTKVILVLSPIGPE